MIHFRSTLSLAVGCLASCLIASSASAQVRIVNYNLAKLAGDQNAIRAALAEMALDNSHGFAVVPAVFTFQEIRAADVVELDANFAAAFPGVPFVRGTFTTSGTEDGSAGAQCMYYRSDLLTEVVSGHVDINTGASRNTDRWLLQLNGYTSAASKFYVYSSHLKASNTSADAQERNTGAIAMRANADALGQGVHCIFNGDYNLYTNTEAAYITMMAAGNAQCLDPLGTANWVGSTLPFTIKHTQSPRLVAGTLIGGGIDDRFDFQISTAECQDGNGFSIIPNTYRTFGNDGNHYNLAINTGNNTYYPADLVRSNSLADVLYDASDHLPVIADYQVPPVMTATMQSTFSPVIVGAVVTIPVTVSNAAHVVHSLGVDALTVAVVGSNGLVGTQNITAALTPAVTIANLTVNTAVAANISATATSSTTVEGTQNPTIARTLTGTVLAHARASFSPKSVVTATSTSASFGANSGTHEITVPVANFGYNALQARLDLDGASGLSAPFAVVDALESNIAAVATTARFSFNTDGRAPGVYSQTAIISRSDENLAGATAGTMSFTMNITVTSIGSPADLDGDGDVDAADLATLLSQWGTAGSADLDGDGAVGATDLATLLGAWTA